MKTFLQQLSYVFVFYVAIFIFFYFGLDIVFEQFITILIMVAAIILGFAMFKKILEET